MYMTTNTILDSETRKLAEIAKAQGWRMDHTALGHVRFYPADKGRPAVIGGGTPSDWRGLLNLRADLRRAGLALDDRHEHEAPVEARQPVESPKKVESPTPSTRKDFSETLRAARITVGMTQSELAATWGIKQATLSHYEKDQRPRSEVFERMCHDFPELRETDYEPPRWGRPVGSKNGPRAPAVPVTGPALARPPAPPAVTGPKLTGTDTKRPSMGEAIRFVRYVREVPDREAVLARLRAAEAQGMLLGDFIEVLSADI
jgi:DNA-binding XRE family transcriptional regulator